LRAAVRRARERAAACFDAQAALFDEAGTRLLEQLDFIKLAPARILDLGCATGRTSAALRTRYPQAHIVSIDPAFALLQDLRRRLLHPHGAICADLERLPLQARSFDLIACNLGAYWCGVDRLLPELLRVAAPGALLLFSTFGPDTLQELRTAFKGIDQSAHVMSFLDMHDIGDALGQSGFAEPIMQMERLTLTYANLAQLVDELAALGMRSLSPQPAPGLYGKHKWQAMTQRYALNQAGLTPASFEIIYATAWKPQQARHLPDGSQVIDFPSARK
jgi:malonyl-CoA O-methyltransferase